MKLNYSFRDKWLLFFCLVVLCSVFMAMPAAAAITLDGAVSSDTLRTGSSITVSHTTGTGTDRLMLVGVSWNSYNTARTISSITFTPDGGSAVSLTQVISQKHGSNYRYSAIYRLLNTPSGQSGTVAVTFSGSVGNGITVGVANFAGVNQSTPLGTAVGASSPSNNTTVTVTLNGLTGDELVFDNVFLGGNPPATLTTGAGQTELWNKKTYNTRGAASTEQATTASVIMSWTAASSSMWVTAAVPIKPAAPSGPTVTINQASGQVDPTNASPINFTVVFSEGVTGFETGDVNLSSSTTPGTLVGTVTEIAPNDGTTYNVAVTGMTGSGTVIASIAAGVAQNGSSQTNAASTSTDNTVTYDVTGPTVTINQASGQADPSNSSTINFTVVFNETVTDFATGDVDLSGSTAPGSLVGTVTGSGTTYNVAVSGMTGSGTVVAGINAGVAHDALGNANDASTSTDNTVTFNLDTTPPTVTINQASGQADPTSSSPINFTVVFSETVTDFATGDVNLSGGTAPGSLTGTVTGSGTTYNVAVSGMTGSGTVIASIAAGVAHDATNNPNDASTSTDNIVTFQYTHTLDGAISSNTVGSGSSISISHTTGTGTNRLMLVGVSWNCGTADRTISSVTFTPDGGAALGLMEVITQLGYNTSNPRYSAIYRLLDPPSGETGTVTVTFNGSVSNGIMAGVANFAGVDQTTPLGSSNGANGNSTAPSVTVTGLNGNELVFDNVFLGAGSSSYTLTVGSGQTQLWNPTYVANLRAAASTEQATSSSVTMSWTASTGNYWAIAAVAINPAEGDQSLPVELTTFKARVKDGAVLLDWVTESEINNAGFEVYRSIKADGEFTLLDSYKSNKNLAGHGNSSTRHTYSYMDPTVKQNQTYWYKLADVDINGRKTHHEPISILVAPEGVANLVPDEYQLIQNYPNPFNPTTKIAYGLPQTEYVDLSIYNLLGQRIRILVSELKTAGNYEVVWDGNDDFNRELPVGIYVYKIQAGSFTDVKKMLLLK